MILCLDVEELLDKISVDSLLNLFCHWQRIFSIVVQGHQL